MEAVKKRKSGITVAVIVILAFAGFAAFNYVRFKAGEKMEVIKVEQIPVQVAESKIMNLQWILEQTGDIRPRVEVDIYPKVPEEIIKSIRVERGDFVKKGTLISTLEDETIRARVREAEAALESAKANRRQVEAHLAVIKKDRTRFKNLAEENAIALQKLDQIEAQYQSTLAAKELATAQIQQAEAVLKQLCILYNNHRIYAPISGWVSARYLDQGTRSDTKKPIIRISDEGAVKIVTTVTERDFPHLRKGIPVEITVDAFPGKVFKGMVSVINPTLDPATRTGEIEVHIPNKDLTLRSGMFAHIRLYLGERKALAIPRDALINLPGTGNYYVFVVENSRALQKNIETGISQGNYIEVISGLKAGEQVVVRGQNRLKDGDRVVLEGQGRSGK